MMLTKFRLEELEKAIPMYWLLVLGADIVNITFVSSAIQLRTNDELVRLPLHWQTSGKQIWVSKIPKYSGLDWNVKGEVKLETFPP